MTKHPVPPADEGLPNLDSGGSILMETEHGLSVCRPLKSLKSSILPAESLDEFMTLLNRYVECGDRDDAIRHYWGKIGCHYRDHNWLKLRGAAVEAHDTQKSARRALIGHLKTIRTTPAKTLDDILFKAEIWAVLEPYDVERRMTVAHSIIADLLSAGCVWTAKTEGVAS
jgi:hypothetical protein